MTWTPLFVGAMLDPNTAGAIVTGMATLLLVVILPVVITSRNSSWRRLVKRHGGEAFNSGIDLSISVPIDGATVDVYHHLDLEEGSERVYRAEARFVSPPGPVFEITRGTWPGEGHRHGVQIGWIPDFDKKFVVVAEDDVNLRRVWHEGRQRALMGIAVGIACSVELSSDGERVTYETTDILSDDKLEKVVYLVADLAAHAPDDLR